MSESFKNILIIKPSALGDIVMALPTLSALRKSFGDAKISWLVRPEFAPLIEGHRCLDEIIFFDRKFLGHAWYNPKAFAALVSLIGRLRRSKFDAVIDLQGLFRTGCLGWLSGCKKRFGMASAREFGSIFYTSKISQDKDSVHIVDYYLKIIRAAGACDTEAEFILPEDLEAENFIDKLLAHEKIDKNNYAVFVPGSAHGDKCWAVEKFGSLADKVRQEFGLSIIATGTDPEKETADKIIQIANTPIANFAGQTNIRQLVALMRNAKLVVSNDTGPGHIAAALGVPVVLIFGRSNPARVAPYGRDNCIAAVEPFGRGLKSDSDKTKHNIQAITVDDVYQKICMQLKKNNEI